jgi:DNA (cytosine-5)-methyltransferase 1
VRYGSVCSGIEAATVAWHGLGWSPSFFSEIDKFPRAVLAAHYPKVPLHGDFTTIQAGEYDPIDLLVGGTPCQSFSVAGLRGGLADGRGNLALEYLKLAQRLRPKWLVWENVPGVLSSAGGRDFGSILGGLVELGYGFAYRVLDAQYFGVPQRRRRVFVVGYLGDWRRAAAVLFERHSLQGHSAPRREAGQRAAPTISARTEGGGGLGTDFDLDGGLIRWPAEVAPSLDAHYGDKMGLKNQHINGGGAYSSPSVAMCLNAGAMGRLDAESETLIPVNRCDFDVDRAVKAAPNGHRNDPSTDNFILHSLRGEGFDASEDGTGRGTPLVPVAYAIQERAVSENLENGPQGKGFQPDTGYTLEARNKVQAVAWSIMPQNSGKDYKARAVDVAQPVMAGGPVGGNQGGDYIQQTSAVRSLTPRECERLQGFPDDYTLISHRGKPAADGPRYKALGNSMAVPVMRWIGERITMVEAA